MIKPAAIIALTHPDASVSRMQFYGEPTDENIEAAIKKTFFPEGVPVSWERKDQAWSDEYSKAKLEDDDSEQEGRKLGIKNPE